MNQQVSAGRCHPQQACVIDEASSEWPSAGTQAFPTPAQADGLAALLLGRGLSACSIGCGEGALEGMLEARGVAVAAVDLDAFADASRWATTRCFCTQVHRVRPDALFLLPSPATTALCFFWGRALPWRQYLARYPQVPLVVIIGDPERGGATEPHADALLGQLGGAPEAGAAQWRCVHRAPVRAITASAVLAVYETV